MALRNITFSADNDLIDRARLLAQSERTTLNDVFREWLTQYTASRSGAARFDAWMRRMKPLRAGRRFTRDEMNER